MTPLQRRRQRHPHAVIAASRDGTWPIPTTALRPQTRPSAAASLRQRAQHQRPNRPLMRLTRRLSKEGHLQEGHQKSPTEAAVIAELQQLELRADEAKPVKKKAAKKVTRKKTAKKAAKKRQRLKKLLRKSGEESGRVGTRVFRPRVSRRPQRTYFK